jgi:hypothetical protein
MALFEATELSAYLQRAVPDDQYRIAYDLAEDAILAEVGSHLADPPQPGVKSVAIALAGRALTNPGGVAAESAGSISVTYTGALSGVVMSAAELRRLRRACGMGARASSLDVSPVATTPPACVDGWVAGGPT